jgi:hypothetical protein
VFQVGIKPDSRRGGDLTTKTIGREDHPLLFRVESICVVAR